MIKCNFILLNFPEVAAKINVLQFSVLTVKKNKAELPCKYYSKMLKGSLTVKYC